MNPYVPFKCPICDASMKVILVMDYFHAHCSRGNHDCWGIEDRATEVKTIAAYRERKRLGNRKVMVTYFPKDENYKISIYVQAKPNPLADHELVTIVLSKEEYETKYKNDNVALRKKLELAETFQ